MFWTWMWNNYMGERVRPAQTCEVSACLQEQGGAKLGLTFFSFSLIHLSLIHTDHTGTIRYQDWGVQSSWTRLEIHPVLIRFQMVFVPTGPRFSRVIFVRRQPPEPPTEPPNGKGAGGKGLTGQQRTTSDNIGQPLHSRLQHVTAWDLVSDWYILYM